MKNKHLFNAGMFVAARGSALVLQLISMPVLAKNLGVEGYANFVMAQAIGLFLGCIVDFGFNATATRKVALVRESIFELSHLVTNIQFVRFILFIGSSVFLAGTIELLDISSDMRMAIYSSLLLPLGIFLTPTWFFQGTEQFNFLLLSGLCIRSICIGALIFLMPQYQSVILACFVVFFAEFLVGVLMSVKVIFQIKKISSINISFVKVEFKSAFQAWLSVLTSVSSATFVPVYLQNKVGFFELGLFSASDKIARTLNSFSWPAAQAFYPKFCLDWNDEGVARRLATRYLISFIAIAIMIVFFVNIFSDFLISLMFSKEFSKSADLLDFAILVLPLWVGNTCLNYFFLYPRGRFSESRRSHVYSWFVFIILLFLLTHFAGVYGAIFSIIISELFLFFWLLRFSLR